jgi:hypothetical protein
MDLNDAICLPVLDENAFIKKYLSRKRVNAEYKIIF